DLQHAEPHEDDAEGDAEHRDRDTPHERDHDAVYARDPRPGRAGQVRGRVRRSHGALRLDRAHLSPYGGASETKGQAVISTGVPSGTSRSDFRSSFRTRTHPCDTALPRSLGLEVPWIAIRPPPGHSDSTGEKPERPSAAIPY